MAMTSRNPEHYTVGIPKLFFYQQKNLEDDRIVDGVALLRAYVGLVDLGSGQVLNADDVSTCKTPEEILAEAYIGNIVSNSLGGEITTQEHTASVEGRQEIDKRILIRRSITYTLGFDEPNQQNLERFFSGAKVGFPLSKVCLGKTTARGSQAAAGDFAEGEIMLLDTHVNLVGQNLSLLEDMVTNQLQVSGINFEPLKIGVAQTQVMYGAVIYFIVSDLQRHEKIETKLESYRNKVLCAYFKYDTTTGKMKVQNWPTGMGTANYTYVDTTIDERLKVFNHPEAETVVGVLTNSRLHTGNTAESGIESTTWAFNVDSPATHQLRLNLSELMIPGSCGITVSGKKYLIDSGTWVNATEILSAFTQAPDATNTRTPLRTNIMLEGNVSGGGSTGGSTQVSTCAVTSEYGTMQMEGSNTITGTGTMVLSGQTVAGANAKFSTNVAANADFVAGTHYNINGVPEGITAKLTKKSDLLAELTFTGAANTATPSVFGISVTLLSAAFSGVSASDFKSTTVKFSAPSATNITATIAKVSTLQGDRTNHIVTGEATFTLSGKVGDTASFTSDAAVLNKGITITGYDSGLTPVLTRVDAQNVKLSFTGAPNAITDMNLVVKFTEAAFTPTPVVQFIPSATQSIVVPFVANDAALAINNTLAADAGTAGAITGSATYTLSGAVKGVTAAFNSSVAVGNTLTAGTHYTITSVPAGLTAVVTKTSASVITLTFTGKATNATGVANIDLDFLDAAYASGLKASDITNGNPPAVSIDFDHPGTASGSIAWDGSYMGLADRTVSGYLTGVLSGTNATFTNSIANGNNLTKGVHYNVTGLPSGMTAKVTKSSASRVVVMLEGNAPAANTGEKTPVAAPITFSITFLDAAYSTPLTSATVTNNARSNVRITFPNAARVDTGSSYFIDPATSYVNHITGEVVLSLTDIFVSDSGMALGARPKQSLEVSASYHAVMGSDALWSGSMWVSNDGSYSNLRVNRGRNELTGAALVVHQNDVGVSMLHMIPRAVLRPDGTLDFSKTDWAKGSFVLESTKSPDAVLPNLSRIVRIPFGFTLTYKYRRNEL